MSDLIPLVVHVSHEAGVPTGGISAVLEGLLGAATYNAAVVRSVLAGPMQGADTLEMDRLLHPRNGVSVRYSSLHGIFDGVPGVQLEALQQVERRFGVAVLYGTRRLGRNDHELLLVDVANAGRQVANTFKYQCWEHFGLDSARFDDQAEFDRYMALAPALFAALRSLGIGDSLDPSARFLVAHDWMALPLVLAAQIAEPGGWRTAYYAHETAAARRLVEARSGHDTSFYNAMAAARAWSVNLETVYGRQDDDFKHALLRLAPRCDVILAVGDLVVDELRFLGGHFSHTPVELVYNGIPAHNTSLAEKQESKAKLQRYGVNLFGSEPTFIFTHFARTILSKAFWRDLRVLEHLDGLLTAAGETALFFLLTTSTSGGRRREWVLDWEEQYGWPVTHRRDNGDLLELEASLYFDGVEPFNRRAKSLRAVLINQSVWRLEQCGRRMPADMDTVDLRRGTDLEFGQSIYEPFGIAQLETLTDGALSCLSSVCGSLGFVGRAAGDLGAVPNIVVADYVSLPPSYWLGSPYDALAIDQGVRDWVEQERSRQVAQQLYERLPRSETQRAALLDTGTAVAARMHWEVVVRDYLLPCLRKIRSASPVAHSTNGLNSPTH